MDGAVGSPPDFISDQDSSSDEFKAYSSDMSPEEVHSWAQKAQLRIDLLEDALRDARGTFEDVDRSSNNQGAVRSAAGRGIDEIYRALSNSV